MFKLEAPYPGVQEIMFLPGPLWGDSESLDLGVMMKRAMDGTRQTHITTTDNEIFNFSFTVTRTMALQFHDFCQSWLHRTMQIVTHKDTKVRGVILENPISINMDSRAVVTVEFSFEGAVV